MDKPSKQELRKATCPTCGSITGISSSDEGTGCFIPVITPELLERIDIALFKAGIVAEIEDLDDAEEITSLRKVLSEYDV